MVDVKRIGYLLFLGLVIGLVLVALRTKHIQTVHQITRLVEQEQQLRQELWDQQVLLSRAVESPVRLKEQAGSLKLAVVPPGE